MSSDDIPSTEFLPAGIRYYLFVGLAGLIVLWLMLTEKFGLFALVPVLLGALGMAGYLIPPNWGTLSQTLRRPLTAMPVFVLLSILVFEVFLGYLPWRYDTGLFRLDDLLIGTALLAYMASQYRLFSLGYAAVPPDPRPRPDRASGDEPDPRPGESVSPGELVWLAGIVGAALLLGQLMWLFVTREWVITEEGEPERVGIPVVPWRMILLVWMLGVGMIVLTGLFRVLRAYRQSDEEARMVLQDALWSETRGEQRRSARWIAWARRQVEREQREQS